MGDIINLRRFKKVKTRDEAAKQSEERRAQFGRTKSEKNKSAAEKVLQARKLDAHKRDD